MQVIEDLIAMKVGKEDKSYVTDVITLETLQQIIEHLMISAMVIEEMYLHVSYATILDTQQSLAEWTKEFLIGIKTLEEIEEEVLTV